VTRRAAGRALLALALSLGAHGIARAAADAADTSEAFRQDVAWSPDGRWLAWSEHRAPATKGADEWAIWIGRADGSRRRVLVANGEWVSFSPAGDRVAFSSKRDGNWDVWSVRTDGGEMRRVTSDPARDRQPAWSPTGDSIAFVSDREGYAQLWIAAASGAGARRVTHDSLRVDCPQWSPDGRELVFQAGAGTNRDRVHIVSLENGATWPASPPEAHDIYPAFLEDGRIVYCAIDSLDAPHVMSMLPDGTAREPLGSTPAFFVRGSQGGRRLAMICGGWPSSTIVITDGDGSWPSAVIGRDAPVKARAPGNR
jgi:dipeptidyl aminopeptidase/acylaminoacyl peptidase